MADGVETTGQLGILKGMGCGKVQGFLIGHPLPVAEIEHLLRAAASLPR